MVSAKLLSHLRQSESNLRRDERRGLMNHPFSDPAFKLIQEKRQADGGTYVLSDVLPRTPSAKVQTISHNVLEAVRIPYQIQPAVHPSIERLERKLIGAPAVPRVYTRDGTQFNEWAVPYESVIWDQPLPDEADLHFVKKDAIRPTSIQKKTQQVSTEVLYDYQFVPVLYAVPEPVFGNRLLDPRDSRKY